jgi:DNA-binding NarL/FixJ family response regulator
MTCTGHIPARGDALLRPAEAHRLTRRELQVMDLIAEGCTNKDIAVQLGIAIHTVKTHVHNLLLKLGLRTRLEVAVWVHAASRESRHREQLQVA